MAEFRVPVITKRRMCKIGNVIESYHYIEEKSFKADENIIISYNEK